MEELKPEYVQEPTIRPAAAAGADKPESSRVYLALAAAFVASVVAAVVFSPLSFMLSAIACGTAYYAHRRGNPAKAWLTASAGASVVFVFGFISSRLSVAAQSSKPWTGGPPQTVDLAVWLWLMPLAGLVTVVAFGVGDVMAYRAAAKRAS